MGVGGGGVRVTAPSLCRVSVMAADWRFLSTCRRTVLLCRPLPLRLPPTGQTSGPTASVCVSVCLSVSLLFCPSVSLSLCLSVSLILFLSVSLSLCASVPMSLYSSVPLSLRLSVFLFIFSLCLSAFLFYPGKIRVEQ